MKKRLLSFSMAVCMVCLMAMTSCSAAEIPAASSGVDMDSAKLKSETQTVSTFSDVPAGAWYAEAVNYCQQNGIMSGTSSTTFSPEATLTRAMLATMLHHMSGTPAVSDAPVFTDVVAGSWYSDAVSWAAKNGVISGYGGGTFGVNDPTTREQAVTILWRCAGEPEITATADISDLSSISSWARAAVYWANANGLLDGMMENSRFDPKETIKRGEVASMLYHYLSNDANSHPELPAGGKLLVAYFSATGTTRPVAEKLAETTGGDLFEIVPAQPYTSADLNYNTDCRANAGQNDPSARPAIANTVENMGQYDTVLIGYPIWWDRAPKIIHTFLEAYDLSGKTVATFCTSGGSGHEDATLRDYEPNANWLEGRRFTGGTDRNTLEEWISALDLPEPSPAVAAAASAASKADFNFDTKRVTLNSGYEMPINGLGTYSLHGETCVSSVKSALASGVRLIDTASAYGNEEEVGQAVREAIEELGLKREDIFVITKIYPGSEMANPEQSIQACLDRLDLGYVDMMLLHHPDQNDVNAYRAMEKFVEDGKIRSLGLSNWYVEELEEFLPQVSIAPALVQNEIHPYYQENDVIPYIQDLGIVVQGWYPLGGRGHTAELLGDEVISGIATAHGVSSAQVILRWNLQKGVVVIPGSSNPDHIKENTELYDFTLTDGDMARINALDRNEKHDWY